MNLRIIISRLVIIAFFTLISYGLSSSIAAGSVMGIILAIISLAAAIMFLYLLTKLHQPSDEEERSEA